MDDIIALFNSLVSGVLALVFGWAILSHRVRDGVVIKVGLILMSAGFSVVSYLMVDGVCGEDAYPLNRAELLVHLGLLVVLFGYAMHRRRGRTLLDIIDTSPAPLGRRKERA
jgi:uncharacterized membrane protein